MPTQDTVERLCLFLYDILFSEVIEMKLTFEINDDLSTRFDMALQLTGEDKNIVLESLMKAYIIQSFSQTASNYQTELHGNTANKNFAKAIHKIPKWASKPMLVPSKIIRAYLQLLDENGVVTYPDLMLRCSDKENHPDEFVATFANNFAQMKFDGEKSHGKVFELIGNQTVALWKNIEEVLIMNKDKFVNCATIAGYINRNNQINLGRTNMRGTNPTNWLYQMRCQECLHEYHANGSDIHLKKCPACQGGADTGTK